MTVTSGLIIVQKWWRSLFRRLALGVAEVRSVFPRHALHDAIVPGVEAFADPSLRSLEIISVRT